MNNFIVFNSQCSKCNLTKSLVDTLDHDFLIINYLEGELTKEQARFIFENITDKSTLLRSELTPSNFEEFFSQIQIEPSALQRPIVNFNGNVFINRPADIFNQYL